MAGVLTVELTGADIDDTLNRITGIGIVLYNIQTVDELSVRFDIMRSRFRELDAICKRVGDSLRIVARKGLYWKMTLVSARPILVFGIVLLVILSVILPGRIYFIKVEGNDTVPTRQILEAAERAGVLFGAGRRSLRSEQVKNQLLGQIPELKWAGVNTHGCTATITVRERSIGADKQELTGMSNIVAVRDGVIQSCTVTKGTALCVPGQAVRVGEILISGYMDLGICVRATGAKGEVFAETEHKLTAISPTERTNRGITAVKESKFSLIIGKKRINFFQGSGIYDVSCVKMYSEYALTLPGGFVLPIKLEVQHLKYAELTPGEMTAEEASAMLSEFSRNYLLDHMIAGEVHRTWETLQCGNGIITLEGRYACLEMIGRQRAEKIGEYHEAD